MCYAGKIWKLCEEADCPSFVDAFLSNQHIRYVYASAGETAFFDVGEVVYTKSDDNPFYRYNCENGIIQKRYMGRYLYLMERMY